MYSIEATNLGSSGEVLYNPELIAEEKRIVYDISHATRELGKAGSFSFTVPTVNPLYGSIRRFGTEISLYKHPGNLLWRGRISSISRDLYCNKIVRCEGALCYLNDIIVRPFTYKTGTGNSFRVSPLYHYGELGKIYGLRCSLGRRFNFTTNIDSSDALAGTDLCSFGGVDSYISVMDAMNDILSLDSELSLDIIYHGADCSLALSRVPFYTLDVSETGVGIDGTVNLINYSDEYDNDDMCTAIIPLGENNRVLYVSDTGIDLDSFQSTNLVEKYGRIERVVKFDSANSDLKLQTAAMHALRQLEREDQPKMTLTAVDLFHLGLNADKIDIGYSVPLSSSVHSLIKTQTYVCTSLSLDIENLENSTYTFIRM